jgi:hypothetical protein
MIKYTLLMFLFIELIAQPQTATISKGTAITE